jgi:hypothetical protein
MNGTLNIIGETLKKLETLHNSRSDLSKQLSAVEEKLKAAAEMDAVKVLEIEELKYVILICISENDNAFFSTYSQALSLTQTALKTIERHSLLLNKNTYQLKNIYQGYVQTLKTRPSCPRIAKLH